jgi:hypothetical protein
MSEIRMRDSARYLRTHAPFTYNRCVEIGSAVLLQPNLTREQLAAQVEQMVMDLSAALIHEQDVSGEGQ